jgi:hypothetical protein
MSRQKPFNPAIQAILEEKRAEEARFIEGLRRIQKRMRV